MRTREDAVKMATGEDRSKKDRVINTVKVAQDTFITCIWM